MCPRYIRRIRQKCPKIALFLTSFSLTYTILLYSTFIKPNIHVNKVNRKIEHAYDNEHYSRNIPGDQVSLEDRDIVEVPEFESDKPESYTAPSCKEKTNFVFIKGMKCATTTLLGVFDRFGVRRNLSFVLPVKWNIYLNWPYPLTQWDFRPDRRGFNILVDHAIFAEAPMAAIMPADSVYISIVRHPLGQLKSGFNYWKVAKLSGISQTVENPVLEYFSDLPRYEAAYQRAGNTQRYCIPDHFSMTRNLQSHCLGLPTGFPPGAADVTGNHSEVKGHLRHLEEKFLLVMVADYFLESLVILRRLMCWAFSDIVFHSANVAFYRYKHWQPSAAFLAQHRAWSGADYQLFHHFNQSLWRRIRLEGEDFHHELEAFRAVQGQVDAFCRKVYSYSRRGKPVSGELGKTVVTQSRWTERFEIFPDDCLMLGPNPYATQRKLQLESNEREGREIRRIERERPDSRNKTQKGLC